MRAWIPSRRSYSFTLSDVTHRTACAAPGYIAPEVLQLMEIAGISDFESLAASTNAPVFTPQTDDFGLAVHIFKMLNRGIHPYASGELDLDIFDLDDDDIPPAPLINSCVCNGHSPFVGTLVGYVVPKYALELDDFSGIMGEALRRSLYGRAEERLDARTMGAPARPLSIRDSCVQAWPSPPLVTARMPLLPRRARLVDSSWLMVWAVL